MKYYFVVVLITIFSVFNGFAQGDLAGDMVFTNNISIGGVEWKIVI